jgi:hypothetical protein
MFLHRWDTIPPEYIQGMTESGFTYVEYCQTVIVCVCNIELLFIGTQANALEVDPLGASGYKAAFSFQNLSLWMSITETELSFALATKIYFPFWSYRYR